MKEKKELSIEEIQQGSLMVLLKIKEIFDKNGWKYYLMFGTLIGAVRHNGFIPWDDDIDIWVPRPDYEKFIDYCIEHKEELHPYELIHYRTNDKYIYPIARFSDSNYKIDYRNSKDYGLGLFVDIYPMDGFFEKDIILKKKIENLQKKICICGYNKIIKSNNKLKNILKVPYHSLIRKQNLKKMLIKLDKIVQKYPYETSKKVGCTCWEYTFGGGHDKLIFSNEKELFHEFNGEMFRIPIGYDKILTSIYGDYMKLPPEEDRIGHHFYTATKK